MRGGGRLHRCSFCGPDSHVHVTARAKCRVEKETIYTRKRGTASEEKANERESDRLMKKQCMQGEFRL